MRSRRWETAVDLFCGSGAVTAALRRSRFRVVAAVDNDPVACGTYRANHPAVRLYSKGIDAVDPAVIRKTQLKGQDLDLLVVCAPCQPFSSQTKKRGEDSRSELILEAARFARVLKPRLIFFENVPGLAARGVLLQRLRDALGPDYVLGDPHRVDAADYDVPQRRVRCIMLACRRATPPPLPEANTPKGQRRTVRQVIGDLKRLSSGECDPKDRLHAARTHQPIALRRLANIPHDGGSRSSLPAELRLACHQHVEDSKYPDVYGRMAWSDVSPTLTTGCTDVTRGRFAHPEDDRALTLREAALLQTFPLDYEFHGNHSDISRQIGNAVPVRLVENLAACFRHGIAAANP